MTQAAIAAVGGFEKGDKARCPLCGKLSLTIKDGDRQPFILTCWNEDHGEHHSRDVYYYIRDLLPELDEYHGAYSGAGQPIRSDRERIEHARGIWFDARQTDRHYRSIADYFIDTYLSARGIDITPHSVRVLMPAIYYDSPSFRAASIGMVLPIKNAAGHFRGVHITWLNGDGTGKSLWRGHPRDTFGCVRGNFVPLSKLGRDRLDVLAVGEGVETVLAYMQLTNQEHGVALSGQANFKHVELPPAREYRLLVDHGAEVAPITLANRLYRHGDARIQICLPPKPKGTTKRGYDWNDALMDMMS